MNIRCKDRREYQALAKKVELLGFTPWGECNVWNEGISDCMVVCMGEYWVCHRFEGSILDYKEVHTFSDLVNLHKAGDNVY